MWHAGTFGARADGSWPVVGGMVVDTWRANVLSARARYVEALKKMKEVTAARAAPAPGASRAIPMMVDKATQTTPMADYAPDFDVIDEPRVEGDGDARWLEDSWADFPPPLP